MAIDPLTAVEFAGVVATWGVANALFAGYEAHVPCWRRFMKLAVLVAVLAGIHIIAGRVWFYVALASMATGIGLLHGWYFHHRHGIHWRTAEPHDRYHRLVGRRKKSR